MVDLSTVGDKVTNIDPGSLTSWVTTMDFNPIFFWIKIFLYVSAFLAVLAYFYKNFYTYKVKITVLRRFGDSGIDICYDDAKEVVDDSGKRKLSLRRTKKGKVHASCPVPAGIYRARNGKKDHYILWLDDNFMLHPVSSPTLEAIKTEEGTIKPTIESHANMKLRPQERDAWALGAIKSLQEKYQKKDMLKEYLPAGILIASMAIGFLIMFFAFRSLEASAGSIGVGLQQIATSCTKMN